MNLFRGDPDDERPPVSGGLFDADTQEAVRACGRYQMDHRLVSLTAAQIIDVLKSLGWRKG
jgi:hypothetical protein